MDQKELMTQLHAYDEWLRLRYGFAEKVWRVERKIRYGTYFNPGMFASPDDWECATDGYCLIMRVPKQEDTLQTSTGELTHLNSGLDQRILYSLWSGDMQRQGGAGAVADKLDNAYYGRLAKSRAAWGDKTEYLAKERWSSMNTSYPQRR